MNVILVYSVAILLCLVPMQKCEYRYDKPQGPRLSLNHQQQTYAPLQQQSVNYAAAATTVTTSLTSQTPTFNTVVNTLGPSNRQYEVQLTDSKRIYEKRQQANTAAARSSGGVHDYLLPVIAASTQGYAQPRSTAYASVYNNNNAHAGRNLQYSTNTNPLLHSQHTSHAVAGKGQYVSYAGTAPVYNNLPQQYAQVSYAQNYAHTQAGATNIQNSKNGQYATYAQGPSAAGANAQYAYRGQHAGSPSGQYAYNPNTNAGSTSGPYANSNYNPYNGQYTGSASGPYAANANLQYSNQANGQHSGNINGQYASGGQYSSNGQYPSNLQYQSNGQNPNNAYASNGQQSAANINGQLSSSAIVPLVGDLGDYVAQSQNGQLDAYPYKQQNGDTRQFTRLITTCYPGGQCDRQQQLAPGQTNPQHEHVVFVMRARIAPVSDKCQRIAEAKKAAAAGGAAAAAAGTYPDGTVIDPNYAGGSYNRQDENNSGLVRPQNRRLFPYSEVEIQRDPYN